MSVGVTLPNHAQKSIDALKPDFKFTDKQLQALKPIFTYVDSLILKFQPSDGKIESVYNAVANYARGVFEAKQDMVSRKEGLTNAFTEAGIADEQLELIQELDSLGLLQLNNTVETDDSAKLAKTAQDNAIALLASCFDKSDRAIVSQIAKVLDGIKCEGDGLAFEKIPQAFQSIENLYKIAQTNKLNPSIAIKDELLKLGLSADQKTMMEQYLKQVLEQGSDTAAASKDDMTKWLKDLALSKEGMLAVGTALYMFSGLLSKVPYIGPLLAAPIQGVQGLLGMAKDLIPMFLLMDKKKSPPEAVQAAKT